MVRPRLEVSAMSSKYLLDVGNDRKTDMHFDDVEARLYLILRRRSTLY